MFYSFVKVALAAAAAATAVAYVLKDLKQNHNNKHLDSNTKFICVRPRIIFILSS